MDRANSTEELNEAHRALARALDACACEPHRADPGALTAAVERYAECARRSGALPEEFVAALAALMREQQAGPAASEVDVRRRWERALHWAVQAAHRRRGAPDAPTTDRR
jgi:hypothetical protein